MAMRLEYIFTFFNDIAEVTTYLEEYSQKAKRIFEKIDKKLSNLLTNPKLYPVYENFTEFRKIVVEDYLVFYKISENSNVIEVHRLIYGKMDIPNHLTRQR